MYVIGHDAIAEKPVPFAFAIAEDNVANGFSRLGDGKDWTPIPDAECYEKYTSTSIVDARMARGCSQLWHTCIITTFFY